MINAHGATGNMPEKAYHYLAHTPSSVVMINHLKAHKARSDAEIQNPPYLHLYALDKDSFVQKRDEGMVLPPVLKVPLGF